MLVWCVRTGFKALRVLVWCVRTGFKGSKSACVVCEDWI